MLRMICVCAIVFVSFTGSTHADLVIGNLGNPINGGALLNGTNQLAFKFTMGSESKAFYNAVLTLENIRAVPPEPSVYLKTGNTANPPVAGLLLTTTTAPGLGRKNYKYTTVVPTVLEANSSYWIHVIGVASWETSATAPSGPFASNSGYRVTNDGGLNWNPYSATHFGAVDINTVPEPASGCFLLCLGLTAITIRRRRAA